MKKDNNIKEKPLILITNDDGIDSPGLKALAEALMPSCELLIAAPKYQQTGMGRGGLKGDHIKKTIGKIEKKYLNINNKSIEAYSINGSPAQSVAHAVLELADRKPDYCISGINYGENLGLAYTCSGTIGAAFEADSLNIPSIAFSKAFSLKKQKSNNYSKLTWDIEKYYVSQIFNKILDKGFPKKANILNVNFPLDVDKSTEIRVTRQAYMNYGKYVKPKERDLSKKHIFEWKLNPEINKAKPDTDIYAIHFDKVISITPLSPIMSIEVDKYHG